MAKIVGGIAVDLIARTQKWVKGFKKAETSVKTFRGSMKKSTANLVAWGAAVAGAALSVRKLVSVFNETRQAIDNLAKTAKRLDLSTEALAGFNLAAQLAGASTDDVAKALTFMSRTIGEAADAGGEYEQALNRIGLTSQFLLSLKTQDQYKFIAEGINRLGTAAERTSAAMDIFGRSGAKSMILISGGAGALDEGIRKAKLYGTAIGEDAAAEVTKMNDLLVEAKTIWEGLATTVTVAVATVFVDLVNATKAWVEQLENVEEKLDLVKLVFGLVPTDKLGGAGSAIDVGGPAGAAAATQPLDVLEERMKEHQNFLAQFRMDNVRSQTEMNAVMTSDSVKWAEDLLQNDIKVHEKKMELDRKRHEEMKRQAEEEARIRKMNQEQSFAFLVSMTGQLASQSKEWFRINKAVSIANAYMNTNEAMTKAMSFGPIAGPIMATAIGVAGAANIAAIAGTSFEGGGSIAGTSGGAAPAAAAAAEPSQQLDVTFTGSGPIPREQVIDFARQLKELIGDGMTIGIGGA